MASFDRDGDTAQRAHSRLTEAFSTGITLPISFRLAQLRALRSFLHETEQEHFNVLHADLRKAHFEFLAFDLRPCYQDIAFFLRNLRRLALPQNASRDYGSPVRLEPHPKGAVLIFGPTNFPTLLIILPLIAAIAAGNVVCIKPSELTPASEKFLLRLKQCLDPRIFAVLTGGPQVCEQLLEYKWDHIMFTGSSSIGKIVMGAAAKHLTPVTLELGGKNPCVVTSSTHLPTAASSVVRARFVNCGQICLAPDYCLVEDSVYDEFVAALVEKIKESFSENPQTCSHYGRLVHSRHFEHVTTLLRNTQGKVLIGGSYDESDQRYVAPTVVEVSGADDALMSKEIFGPVLPVMRISDVESAITLINEREKPLALYVFSRDKGVTDSIVTRTRSGSVGVNETVFQVFGHGSFVGGVGESGMGAYLHARGFEEFSHLRPVMYSNQFWARLMSPMQTHVASSNNRTKNWLEVLLRFTGSMPFPGGQVVPVQDRLWELFKNASGAAACSVAAMWLKKKLF